MIFYAHPVLQMQVVLDEIKIISNMYVWVLFMNLSLIMLIQLEQRRLDLRHSSTYYMIHQHLFYLTWRNLLLTLIHWIPICSFLRERTSLRSFPLWNSISIYLLVSLPLLPKYWIFKQLKHLWRLLLIFLLEPIVVYQCIQFLQFYFHINFKYRLDYIIPLF